jgi:hypothetical protein
MLANTMFNKILVGMGVGSAVGAAVGLITQDAREVTKEGICKVIGIGAACGAIAGQLFIGEKGVLGLIQPSDSPSLIKQYFPKVDEMLDNPLINIAIILLGGIALGCCMDRQQELVGVIEHHE